ncbi:MAG: tRNA glutamyl-Q(34) synthetase GluQRS [Pseudomonadota bacterium]
MSLVNRKTTRFAPSPTGYLHLGHAASAWHVWRTAKDLGAQVLLRIEDIDPTRCRPEFTAAISEDLSWLGFSWPEPIRMQSDHFDAYADIVRNLAQRGLAYRCFLTRREIAIQALDGQAVVSAPLSPSVEAARLEAGDPFAWRLNLCEAKALLGPTWSDLSYRELTPNGPIDHPAEPERHGNIVLARKDSPTAYHLAATYDDALQEVTDVVRGRDLEDAPHIQVLLQALMNWPQVTYHHHDLITDSAGRRLSKTDKSVSLRALRADGLQPSDVWRRLQLE